MARKAYPADVTDDGWAFVAPYPTLMREGAPQREHGLPEVFNAPRWMVRAGAPRRMMPNDFPPWHTVHQQPQRWIAAGVFGAMAHDLRELPRVASGREPDPTAAVLDSRTPQSTPESGRRAGYDGAERKRGSKVHIGVGTPGHLPTLRVTGADQRDRAQVKALAKGLQRATGKSVKLAFVDQGYTGETPAADAKRHGIESSVAKLPHAKRGFVLLPRRWVVERTSARAARSRRLAKGYERLPTTLAGLHLAVFVCLMLNNPLGHSP